MDNIIIIQKNNRLSQSTNKSASKKVKEVSKKSKVIVVLSAMAGVTNSLVDKIKNINDNDDPDSDLILSTGEQISSGLMSIYLNKEGIKSRTWTGWWKVSSLFLNCG